MARTNTIPMDEPVLVDLGDDEEVISAADVDAAQDEEPARKKPDAEDPAITALKAQIEQEKAAREDADKRVKIEAEARAKAESELAQGRGYIADSEANAVAHALFSAQMQVTNAKAEIKAAFESGDSTALADAQERMGRATAEAREYERMKTDMAQRKPAEKQAQQQPRDVNEMIDAMQVLPAERVWLKAHPEAVMDRSRNTELDAAYIKATRKGIVRGTPDYFKFLEREMGYSQENDMNDHSPQVSAPVTRNSPTGLRPNQVRLSPAQREMASMLSLSDKEYAEGVMQMEGDKRANPEKYAQR